jgi:hypothetical protein
MFLPIYFIKVSKQPDKKHLVNFDQSPAVQLSSCPVIQYA